MCFYYKENVCDFVVIEMMDFFLDWCDIFVKRVDKKKVNV